LFFKRKGAISGADECIFQRIAIAILWKIREAHAPKEPFAAQRIKFKHALRYNCYKKAQNNYSKIQNHPSITRWFN